jgi:uncharacterized protein (DUF58 family)
MSESPATPPRTLDELIPPELSARLDRLDLLSRKMLAGKMPGERRSKRRGRSVEFDDFRNYVAGDDLRHIDWNIYARLDRLFIKLFREEEDLALHIILDVSASMHTGAPIKSAFAARLAMALGYIGLVNQNRVSIAAFGRSATSPSTNSTPSDVRALAAMRGRRSVQPLAAFILESLADQATHAPGTSPPARESFTNAMRRLAQARAGKGVVVILSDFLIPAPSSGVSACREGLTYLAAANATPASFDTYALQILSPAELDPTVAQSQGLIGDLRLTDAESGRAVEVTVTPATIERYKASLLRHTDQLRADCLSLGIAHFNIRTDTPVVDLVMQTLRRGGLFR